MSSFKTAPLILYHTVVGEGLSPPSSLLRVNPSPTSSRSRSLRSSAPKVSSWVCRSLLEGLFDALLSDTGVNGSSFRPVGEGKPPEMGGSPPIRTLKVSHFFHVGILYSVFCIESLMLI